MDGRPERAFASRNLLFTLIVLMLACLRLKINKLGSGGNPQKRQRFARHCSAAAAGFILKGDFMDQQINAKVAVVTGGTRGIGYSIASKLLDEGSKVVICGRSPDRLEAAMQELSERHSGRVSGMLADVRNYRECQALIQHAARTFGGVDILVNNAGIGYFKPVDQITPEEWDELLATNLSGVFYCVREVVPLMRKRGGGYIFNISSLAGVNPFAGGAAYNASKFGLNGFSEAIMQDLRYDGIRVSYVMPGSVGTDFGPHPGRKAPASWKLTGEDIAKAVVDLLKYPSSSLASRIELRPLQPPKK